MIYITNQFDRDQLIIVTLMQQLKATEDRRERKRLRKQIISKINKQRYEA
jgi:hypothetical protein